MPQINFSFEGYVRRADITEAYNEEGRLQDVSHLTKEELISRLHNGSLRLNVEDILVNSEADIVVDTDCYT